MSNEMAGLFAIFGGAVVLVLVIGLYCVLTTRNLFRVLIGMELLTKAVTLLIISAGHAVGQSALAQALVITLIIVEVAVIVAAVSIVMCVHRNSGSIDSAQLRQIR